MATNGAVDGAQKKAVDKFDPNFTKNVINATGPKASPRMRKVIGSLIQHLHDFARENEITIDEWMAGVELVATPLDVQGFMRSSLIPRSD